MAFGNYSLETGKALPLGARLTGRGVNFSLFSRNASAVSLVLFENPRSDSPWQELPLDRKKNKTGDLWHCHVPGLEAGALYLYRVEGPYNPERGFRFNANKHLLDPYARALTDLEGWDLSACTGYDPGDPALDLSFSWQLDRHAQPRCIVIDDEFDWQGDTPLNYPLRFSVLYETHVRGLTKHANSGVAHPGTYRGVYERNMYRIFCINTIRMLNNIIWVFTLRRIGQ
jgi:glycogen operon protein